MSNKCVIVLTPPRSGSSAISGVLHQLGVCMGTHLLAASVENPAGFFEDMSLLNLHKQMLDYCWHNPGPPYVNALLPQYRQQIAQRAKQPLWGIKDPRLCFLLPQLIPVFQEYDCDVQLVLPQRDPVEIVASLLSPNFQPGEGFVKTQTAAQHTCQRYLNARQMVLSQLKLPALPLDYAELIHQPQLQVQKLCEFLNIQPSAAALEAAVASVNPQLHRQRNGLS